MSARADCPEPYTVTARIVVSSPGLFAAEVAVRTALGDLEGEQGILGAIIEATEPSEPRDVAWLRARQ